MASKYLNKGSFYDLKDMFEKIQFAKETWEKGKFVMIHDFKKRENEVDLVIPSAIVNPDHVAFMRTYGGGLICTALTHDFSYEISLPFMSAVLNMTGSRYPVINLMTSHSLPYGARSSFSITVNHVNSFTGITDIDRALTIRELGKLHLEFEKNELKGLDLVRRFGTSFRSPGHVHLLRASPGLLRNRQGHTELGIALAQLTKQPQSISLVEMLDSETHRALSLEKAKKIAEEHDLPLLSGGEILKLWRSIFKIPQQEIKKTEREEE